MSKKLLIWLGLLLIFPPSLSRAQIFENQEFIIARSFKLGYEETGKFSNTNSFENGGGIASNSCKTDADCPKNQHCSESRCVDVCQEKTCTNPEKPNCSVNNHSAVCKCTETSCPNGEKCSSDGNCTVCSAGEKCNCPGAQVSNGTGACFCEGKSTCAAGEYFKEIDCTCGSCLKDEKCSCLGDSVSDGAGGCYCKTIPTCTAGQQKNLTTCRCEPCAAGSTSCENPCPDGEVPTGSGSCASHACSTDNDCGQGYLCKNPATASAECIPCPANEQCSCSFGYLADGNGNCISVSCNNDYDCDLGYLCSNPSTVNSMCSLCEKDTPCNCADGYLADGTGNCVPVECTNDNGCSYGQYCSNPETTTASCENCSTKFSNCVQCSSSTCTECKSDYALVNGKCISKSCPDGYVWGTTSCVSTSCSDGYVWGGSSCVAANCPSGYSTSTTSCDSGYTLETNGKSGSKTCGKCVPTPCPSGFSTSVTSCGANQALQTSGVSAGNDCGKCVTVSCPPSTPAWNGSSCVQCTGNVHCKSFEYCSSNKCVLQAGRCYTSDDCKDSDKCVSNSCVPTCTPNPCSGTTPSCSVSIFEPHIAQCKCSPSPNSCQSGYVCVNSGGYNCKPATCSSDNDCEYDKKCDSNGKCVDPCSLITCSGTTPNCFVSSKVATCKCSPSPNSCQSGYVCVNSGGYNCKPATCSSDSDCEYDKKCSGGKCIDPCTLITCSGTTPRCSVGFDRVGKCYCSSYPNSCPNGYVCDGSTCKMVTTEQCTTDDDCSAEKRCSGGYCIYRV